MFMYTLHYSIIQFYIKRKGLDYLLQFYLNSNEINTTNILEIFSTRLYAFNNISGRNPILDDVSYYKIFNILFHEINN